MMTDEPSHPTVRVGQVDTVVTDPHHLLPVSCELITDLRIFDGVLFLSLASHISDGSGPAEARVVARLRIPLATLSGIQAGITRSLEEVEQSKKTAN